MSEESREESRVDGGRRRLLRASAVILGGGLLVGTGVAGAEEDKVEFSGNETVVDDFGDGDLSEYTEARNFNRFSGTFGIEESATGDRYLRGESSSPEGSNPNFLSLSGLNYYPSRGDKIQYYTKYEGRSTSRFQFGVQSWDNNSREGYRVSLNARDGPGSRNPDSLVLLKHENDTEEVLATEDASLTNYRGEWLRTVVDWGDSIRVTVYDSNDDDLATLSVRDTTYSEGGIGFTLRSYYNGSNSTSWDRVTAVKGGSSEVNQYRDNPDDLTSPVRLSGLQNAVTDFINGSLSLPLLQVVIGEFVSK